MEDSILNNTKKVLGVAEDYTVFDYDITTYINSAFSTLTQLGVGPVAGFTVEDANTKWSDLDLTQDQLNMVKTYVFLKARMLFDPPTTSFHIEAMNNQIREHEWRISTNREWGLDPVDPREGVGL